MTGKNTKMFLFYLRMGAFDGKYLGLWIYLGFGAWNLVFGGWYSGEDWDS